MTEEACRQAGLSPRVRGNLRHLVRQQLTRGSIPACAGEPKRTTCTSPAPRVYPRVCGGTSIRAPRTSRSAGLSPRVRGNRGRGAGSRREHGSIPACAGEPSGWWRALTISTVYPRVCGGTDIQRAKSRHRAGLSPRVRGNRAPCGSSRTRTRSIPACAGEPIPAAIRCRTRRVYPRVCGGTEPVLDDDAWVGGLSPRVRGNLLDANQRITK